jgi:hypothetical protein
MDTLLDNVVWRGKLLEKIDIEEKCLVVTRRITWFGLATRSRSTVLPVDYPGSTPGFIVWWNSNDPLVLQQVHPAMVQTIQRIGFTEPATWCERRHLNRSASSLPNFWRQHLGELFRYYRKAT